MENKMLNILQSHYVSPVTRTSIHVQLRPRKALFTNEAYLDKPDTQKWNIFCVFVLNSVKKKRSATVNTNIRGSGEKETEFQTKTE